MYDKVSKKRGRILNGMSREEDEPFLGFPDDKGKSEAYFKLFQKVKKSYDIPVVVLERMPENGLQFSAEPSEVVKKQPHTFVTPLNNKGDPSERKNIVTSADAASAISRNLETLRNDQTQVVKKRLRGRPKYFDEAVAGNLSSAGSKVNGTMQCSSLDKELPDQHFPEEVIAKNVESHDRPPTIGVPLSVKCHIPLELIAGKTERVQTRSSKKFGRLQPQEVIKRPKRSGPAAVAVHSHLSYPDYSQKSEYQHGRDSCNDEVSCDGSFELDDGLVPKVQDELDVGNVCQAKISTCETQPDINTANNCPQGHCMRLDGPGVKVGSQLAGVEIECTDAYGDSKVLEEETSSNVENTDIHHSLKLAIQSESNCKTNPASAQYCRTDSITAEHCGTDSASGERCETDLASAEHCGNDSACVKPCETVSARAEQSGTDSACEERCGTDSANLEHCGTDSASVERFRTDSASGELGRTDLASAEQSGTDSASVENCGIDSASVERFRTDLASTEHCGTDSVSAEHCGTDSVSVEDCETDSGSVDRCGTDSASAEHCGTDSSSEKHCNESGNNIDSELINVLCSRGPLERDTDPCLEACAIVSDVARDVLEGKEESDRGNNRQTPNKSVEEVYFTLANDEILQNCENGPVHSPRYGEIECDGSFTGVLNPVQSISDMVNSEDSCEFHFGEVAPPGENPNRLDQTAMEIESMGNNVDSSESSWRHAEIDCNPAPFLGSCSKVGNLNLSSPEVVTTTHRNHVTHSPERTQSPSKQTEALVMDVDSQLLNSDHSQEFGDNLEQSSERDEVTWKASDSDTFSGIKNIDAKNANEKTKGQLMFESKPEQNQNDSLGHGLASLGEFEVEVNPLLISADVSQNSNANLAKTMDSFEVVVDGTAVNEGSIQHHCSSNSEIPLPDQAAVEEENTSTSNHIVFGEPRNEGVSLHKTGFIGFSYGEDGRPVDRPRNTELLALIKPCVVRLERIPALEKIAERAHYGNIYPLGRTDQRLSVVACDKGPKSTRYRSSAAAGPKKKDEKSAGNEECITEIDLSDGLALKRFCELKSINLSDSDSDEDVSGTNNKEDVTSSPILSHAVAGRVSSSDQVNAVPELPNSSQPFEEPNPSADSVVSENPVPSGVQALNELGFLEHESFRFGKEHPTESIWSDVLDFGDADGSEIDTSHRSKYCDLLPLPFEDHIPCLNSDKEIKDLPSPKAKTRKGRGSCAIDTKQVAGVEERAKRFRHDYLDSTPTPKENFKDYPLIENEGGEDFTSDSLTINGGGGDLRIDSLGLTEGSKDRSDVPTNLRSPEKTPLKIVHGRRGRRQKMEQVMNCKPLDDPCNVLEFTPTNSTVESQLMSNYDAEKRLCKSSKMSPPGKGAESEFLTSLINPGKTLNVSHTGRSGDAGSEVAQNGTKKAFDKERKGRWSENRTSVAFKDENLPNFEGMVPKSLSKKHRSVGYGHENITDSSLEEDRAARELDYTLKKSWLTKGSKFYGIKKEGIESDTKIEVPTSEKLYRDLSTIPYILKCNLQNRCRKCKNLNPCASANKNFQLFFTLTVGAGRRLSKQLMETIQNPKDDTIITATSAYIAASAVMARPITILVPALPEVVRKILPMYHANLLAQLVAQTEDLEKKERKLVSDMAIAEALQVKRALIAMKARFLENRNPEVQNPSPPKPSPQESQSIILQSVRPGYPYMYKTNQIIAMKSKVDNKFKFVRKCLVSILPKDGNKGVQPSVGDEKKSGDVLQKQLTDFNGDRLPVAGSNSPSKKSSFVVSSASSSKSVNHTHGSPMDVVLGNSESSKITEIDLLPANKRLDYSISNDENHNESIEPFVKKPRLDPSVTGPQMSLENPTAPLASGKVEKPESRKTTDSPWPSHTDDGRQSHLNSPSSSGMYSMDYEEPAVSWAGDDIIHKKDCVTRYIPLDKLMDTNMVPSGADRVQSTSGADPSENSAKENARISNSRDSLRASLVQEANNSELRSEETPDIILVQESVESIDLTAGEEETIEDNNEIPKWAVVCPSFPELGFIKVYKGRDLLTIYDKAVVLYSLELVGVKEMSKFLNMRLVKMYSQPSKMSLEWILVTSDYIEAKSIQPTNPLFWQNPATARKTLLALRDYAKRCDKVKKTFSRSILPRPKKSTGKIGSMACVGKIGKVVRINGQSVVMGTPVTYGRNLKDMFDPSSASGRNLKPRITPSNFVKPLNSSPSVAAPANGLLVMTRPSSVSVASGPQMKQPGIIYTSSSNEFIPMINSASAIQGKATVISASQLSSADRFIILPSTLSAPSKSSGFVLTPSKPVVANSLVSAAARSPVQVPSPARQTALVRAPQISSAGKDVTPPVPRSTQAYRVSLPAALKDMSKMLPPSKVGQTTSRPALKQIVITPGSVKFMKLAGITQGSIASGASQPRTVPSMTKVIVASSASSKLRLTPATSVLQPTSVNSVSMPFPATTVLQPVRTTSVLRPTPATNVPLSTQANSVTVPSSATTALPPTPATSVFRPTPASTVPLTTPANSLSMPSPTTTALPPSPDAPGPLSTSANAVLVPSPATTVPLSASTNTLSPPTPAGTVTLSTWDNAVSVPSPATTVPLSASTTTLPLPTPAGTVPLSTLANPVSVPSPATTVPLSASTTTLPPPTPADTVPFSTLANAVSVPSPATTVPLRTSAIRVSQPTLATTMPLSTSTNSVSLPSPAITLPQPNTVSMSPSSLAISMSRPTPATPVSTSIPATTVSQPTLATSGSLLTPAAAPSSSVHITPSAQATTLPSSPRPQAVLASTECASSTLSQKLADALSQKLGPKVHNWSSLSKKNRPILILRKGNASSSNPIELVFQK